VGSAQAGRRDRLAGQPDRGVLIDFDRRRPARRRAGFFSAGSFSSNRLDGRAKSHGEDSLDVDITYNAFLRRPCALASFVLWNDVNVSAEGINNFSLRFHDAADALIATAPVLTGPVGQLAPQTYTFASVVTGVSKVNLDVLSSNIGVVEHIEIREVAFNGIPTLAVPEPSTWAMLVAGLGLLGFAARRRNVR